MDLHTLKREVGGSIYVVKADVWGNGKVGMVGCMMHLS